MAVGIRWSSHDARSAARETGATPIDVGTVLGLTFWASPGAKPRPPALKKTFRYNRIFLIVARRARWARPGVKATALTELIRILGRVSEAAGKSAMRLRSILPAVFLALAVRQRRRAAEDRFEGRTPGAHPGSAGPEGANRGRRCCACTPAQVPRRQHAPRRAVKGCAPSHAMSPLVSDERRAERR